MRINSCLLCEFRVLRGEMSGLGPFLAQSAVRPRYSRKSDSSVTDVHTLSDHDRWVQQRGAPVEVDKQDLEKGTYQHPELYPGAPGPEMGMNYDATHARPEPVRSDPAGNEPVASTSPAAASEASPN